MYVFHRRAYVRQIPGLAKACTRHSERKEGFTLHNEMSHVRLHTYRIRLFSYTKWKAVSS